jgi:hypothetical protein
MGRAADGRQAQVRPPSEANRNPNGVTGKGVQAVIRGFVTGVIWGAVVATTGLAVLSQVAPLPNRPGMADAPAAPVAEPVPAPVAEPVAEPLPQEVPPDAVAAAEPVPDAAPEAGPEAAAPAAPDAEILQPEILQKVPDPAPEDEIAAAPEDDAVPAPALAPLVSTPVPDPSPAPAPAPDATAGALVAPDPVVDAAPEAPVPPEVPGDPAALPPATAEAAPGLNAMTPPTAPQAEAAPVPPAPPEEALLQPDPVEEAPPAPALIVPDAPLPGSETGESDIALAVPGVTTDRLPRIGDDNATVPQGMEAAPETAPEAALPEVLLGTTPLELFRRDFDNPEGKPIFGLILIDEGLPAAERETLAALPFPVTFALDPLAPHSADAARVYRAAGQEVAMVANGIPEGATPGDLEQTFQALDMAMPEAVAVLDRLEGGFQDSLDLARQAVPIVAEQGRGVVTYDRGLNSADQVARREAVPRATIFRVLDSEGESIPKMRNYLDRAAFKAAQEGRVLVIGRARAETVAAILEWTVEGRAASVALAPLSAVLETTTTP